MKKLLFTILFFTCLQASAQNAAEYKKLKDQQTVMQTSISQLNAALVKMIVLYAEKDKKIDQLSDSVRVLRESIPAIVRNNQSVLYFKGNGIIKNGDTILIK